MYLAGRTERSVDAFLFLIDAMKRVAAALPGGDQVHHVNARQVCGAVRDYAVEQAGDAQAALVLLADLGIQRSEEIGALVYAVIEVGIFAASESDTPDDFDGLPEVIGSSHETRE